jgi:sec-independent protein translocase protein TatB
MFEIGWTEMLVIAVVMIVVVGPKDLPKMLRAFGKTTAKLRSMAGDFQKQFNEALKEAELDDVKKSVESLKGLNPATEIKKQLNPFEKAAADVRAGLDTLKPKPPEPASPVAKASEPLKNGAAAIPGEGVVADSTTPATAAPSTPAPAVQAAAVAPAELASVASGVAETAAPPKAAKKPAAKKTNGTAAAKPKAARAKKKTESSAP